MKSDLYPCLGIMIDSVVGKGQKDVALELKFITDEVHHIGGYPGHADH